MGKVQDRELIIKLKAGNAEAFSQLYNKYWERLYHAAYSRLKSREETEDIIHDLFVDLWNRKDVLKIDSCFEAYIFTALKYKIFRLIDSKSVRNKYLEDNLTEENQIDQIDRLDLEDLYDKIEEKVELLPKKCRVVFKLRKQKNYSIKEISQKLNISPNTTKNHLSKAIKFLRVELNDLFFIAIILIELFKEN